MATTDQIGKYQIIEFLGRGFFGEVFLCYDPFMKKERAIKIIKVPDPDKFVSAVKEGQILDLCRHKHIVDVKDIGATLFNGDPVVMIIMEYLSRGSVQKRIEKRFISVKEACKIIEESLLGLEHAHNQNILHRDIKPANILIGDNDELKLSDFGLAIDYHSEPSDVKGYKSHQPLEVIEGNPMNKLSDIYAMGITFFRLLNNTNKFDFNFATKEEFAKALKREKFPPRQYQLHIPDKIIRILNKSIQNKTNLRFQDCTRFRQAIEKIDFGIDWVRVDEDMWIGQYKDDSFELSKIRKRNGWKIDYKKNGIRRSLKSMKSISDSTVNTEFYGIIRNSTIN